VTILDLLTIPTRTSEQGYDPTLRDATSTAAVPGAGTGPIIRDRSEPR
jgi:hypothetical protein